jgi:TonB family protein
MQLASFVLSVCLHAGLALLVWFWPVSRLSVPDSAAVTVSLVDGLPGGNRAPSPILGPLGDPGKTPAPPMPAPPSKAELSPPEPAQTAPARAETLPPPKPAPPKPSPEQDAVPLVRKKQPEPPPEPPKEEAQKVEPPKTAPSKPEPPKKEPGKVEAPKVSPPASDPVKAALEKARAASGKSPQGERAARSGSVERALAIARKQSGGSGGGGGGEGAGEGGGGLGDIYAAQIMLAVRPNWSWPAQTRNLAVGLYIKIDAAGAVLDARVENSSGNAAFDSSAVSAVRMTGYLPPPPGPQYREIVMNFYPD